MRGGRREHGPAAATSQDMIQQLQRSGWGGGSGWLLLGSVRGDLPETFWVGTHTTWGLGAGPVSLCFTSTCLGLLLILPGKLRQKGVCRCAQGEGTVWLWIPLWCSPHGQSGESR